MAESLFPERQRCKKCGKKLENTVVLGLYDSYRCATMAEPMKKPEDAPRECKTQRDGVWQFKRRFRSEKEIPKKLQEDPSSNWYWCTSSCGTLHIGHSRVNIEVEKQRVMRSRKDLSDILIKMRGNATLKQIAARADVRPVRLKELEDPKQEVIDISALFKVMKIYRIQLTIAF